MEISQDIEKQCVIIGKAVNLNPEKLIHVGYGTDDNFVIPTGVSIISVLESNPDCHFIFHILTEGISQSNQEKLAEIAGQYNRCTFMIHTVNLNILQGLPVYALGKTTYIRVFLGQILKGKVEKLLYLDGDTVCIRSLVPLLKKEFASAVVMAVEDVPKVSEKQGEKFHVQHYFNAGMLYINLKKWQEAHIAEKFLDVCFQYKEKLNYLDQDALNIVLDDKKILVSRAFNYIALDDQLPDVPDDTAVIHYAGTKPWYCWLQFPLQKYFRKYYSLSPWKEQSLDEPRNYREMHYMSRFYKRKGEWGKSLYWLIQYLVTKVKTK